MGVLLPVLSLHVPLGRKLTPARRRRDSYAGSQAPVHPLHWRFAVRSLVFDTAREASFLVASQPSSSALLYYHRGCERSVKLRSVARDTGRRRHRRSRKERGRERKKFGRPAGRASCWA